MRSLDPSPITRTITDDHVCKRRHHNYVPFSCLGVSTVHGNALLEKVTKDCLCRVMFILNKSDIPIHAGLSRGLMHENFSASNIHGKSGLDGTALLPQLWPKDKPSGKKAPLTIAEEILARAKDTVLVATGSMTNVAILISLFPKVVEWIKGHVIMGGRSQIAQH